MIRKVQGVPFDVNINVPAGLLNVSYRMIDDLLYVLTSCINAGLQPLFPFDKHRFQYFA
jgi:hypothetical protein